MMEISGETEEWVITGGTGFIGQKLVHSLLQQIVEYPQVKLNCLIRITSEIGDLVNDNPTAIISQQLSFKRISLEDFEQVNKSISKNTTFIFHCAAQGGDWGPKEYFVESNLLSTINLIKVAENLPKLKRFLHLSTVDVYPHLNPKDCTEDVQPITSSPYHYSWTKAMAEYELLNSQIPWTILRPGVVFGPKSFSWGLQEAILINKGRGLFISGAKFKSGMVYVDDVVRAILLAANSSRTIRQQYNVTNPDSCGTWREFYDAIADGIGKPRVKFSIPYWLASGIASILEFTYRTFRWHYNRPLLTHFLLRLISCDQLWPIAKAEADFGWKPLVSQHDGTVKLIEWLNESKAYCDDYLLH